LFRAHNLIIIFLAWLQVSDERDGLLVGRNYTRVRLSRSDVKYIPSESFRTSKNIFTGDLCNSACLTHARLRNGVLRYVFAALRDKLLGVG